MKKLLSLKLILAFVFVAAPQGLAVVKAKTRTSKRSENLTALQKKHVKYLKKVITLERLKGREVELVKKYPKGVPVSLFLWSLKKDGTTLDWLRMRVWWPFLVALRMAVVTLSVCVILLAAWPLGLKAYRHFYPRIPSFTAKIEIETKKAYLYEKVRCTIDFNGKNERNRYQLNIEHDPAVGTITGGKQWLMGKEKIQLVFVPKKKNAELPKISITDKKEEGRIMKDGVVIDLPRVGELTYIEPAQYTQELIAPHEVIIKQLDWKLDVKKSRDRDKATIEIEPSDQEQWNQDLQRLKEEKFEVRAVALNNLAKNPNHELLVVPSGTTIQISGLTKLQPKHMGGIAPSVDLRVKNLTTKAQKMISVQVKQLAWKLDVKPSRDRDKAMLNIVPSRNDVSQKDREYLLADGWKCGTQLKNLREDKDFPLGVSLREGTIQISGLTKLHPLRNPASVELTITNTKTGAHKKKSIPVKQLDWQLDQIAPNALDRLQFEVNPTQVRTSQIDRRYLQADGYTIQIVKLTNLSESRLNRLKKSYTNGKVQISGLTKLKPIDDLKGAKIKFGVTNKKTGAKKTFELDVSYLCSRHYDIDAFNALKGKALEQFKEAKENEKRTRSLGNEEKALLYAIRNTYLDVVQYLAPKADKEGKNEALVLAAQTKHKGLVLFLLKYASQGGKNMAQMEASKDPQNSAIVELLLPYASENANSNALVLAADKDGFVDNLRVLLPKANEKSRDLALEKAAQKGYPNAARTIAPHATPAGRDKALLIAVQKGYSKTSREIFPHVKNQETKNKALLIAASKGNKIIAKGVAPHATPAGRSAALVVASALPNNLDVVKELLKYPLSVIMPFQKSVLGKKITSLSTIFTIPPRIRGSLEFVKDGEPANIKEFLTTATYEKRRKALVENARAGYLGAVKELQSRLQPEALTYTAQALAIREAVKGGYLEVAKEILFSTPHGRDTALLVASAHPDNLGVVKELLKNLKPSVSALNHALLVAILAGNLEVVKILIEGGADKNHVYKKGLVEDETPWYYAAWKGHEAIEEYLNQIGAIVPAGADGVVIFFRNV